MRELLQVSVVGTPAPKGSKRHVGNGIMVESSTKVRPWQEAVKHAVLSVHQEPPAVGQLYVNIQFWLTRPKGHYRTGANAHLLRDSAPARPASKPDVDKLVRSTLDALKEAGVYRDDSQVVDLVAGKYYAGYYQTAGALIIVGGVG